MQQIQKIYELFAEEAFNNTQECKINGNIHIEEPTPIYLEQWNSSHALFSYMKKGDKDIYENELITVRFNSDVRISPIKPPSFNYLFWIEPKDDKYYFKYVECGSVTPLEQLDIAFDDSTKIAFNVADSQKLTDSLMNDYVFDAGKYKLLFVKAWQNGGQNWNVFGFKTMKESDHPKMIDVPLEENNRKEKVRVVRKETRKRVCFPSHFDEMDVLAYENIAFVDIGMARVAHDALIEKEHKGDALMSLWKEYSKIELEVAREEIDELGKIEYSFCGRPKDGVAHLELSINPDQTSMIKRLADSNAQFNLVCDRPQPPMVTLLKFNPATKQAKFKDELYRLPAKGALQLSLLGNEIVYKRRTMALKQLLNGKNIVIQNLLFAIEDEADKMFEDRHNHIAPTSKKTMDFLREKFGIEKLTPNQEEAVEIALNNRKDITVIQGPPGTGKTTVIAAICHRLLELAGSGKDETVKVILASAFQNDTIEHLASKIYTHQLPTVKVGKRHMGVKTEKVFINEMEKHLQSEIDKRGGDDSASVSFRLGNLASLLAKEKDTDMVLEKIQELLPDDTPITGVDFDKLREIKSAMRSFNRKIGRNLDLIDSIPTTENSYNINGWSVISDVLQGGFNLSEDDKEILENAPETNPDKGFIKNLTELKSALSNRMREEKETAAKTLQNELFLWIEEARTAVRKYEETNYENEDSFIRSVLTDLKKDLHGNTEYIRRTLQEYGETVAATNQLAGSKEMKDFLYIKNVILEDAARSNPLDLIIPMIKAEDRIILVGDQNQLPHLLETEVAERSLAHIENVDEKKEKRRMYEQSLFGIIFDNVQKGRRQRSITLNEQFRMHPTIGDFISNTFYMDSKTGMGKLKAGSESLYETKRHHLSLPWAKDKTMVFCNVGNEHPEGRGQSKYRVEEAERVMSIMDELKKDPAFGNLTVGIITFYSRQVTTLFEEAAKPQHGYAVKTKDGYDIHEDYRLFGDDQEKFRIGSVDSFQGKEFDIVILSTVRSNNFKREDGNEKKVFGFLTLKNRLNVAFSRAKRLVIVVGDGHMFEDEYAKKYVPGLYEYYNNITLNTPYGNRI